MAFKEIPLEPAKQIVFQTDLDGFTVEFTFRWNLTGRYWTFNLTGQSLTDTITGAAVVTGLDLLEPYAIRELGQLFCVDGKDLGEDPDFDNFGARWSLIYVEKSSI